METKHYLCLIAIFVSLHENGKSRAFACSVNQTLQEEITIEENKQVNFSYQLNEDKTLKNSAFIIAIILCEHGTYHDACLCRWVSEENFSCEIQRNVSICEMDNSEMRFSLFVERTYSNIFWKLYAKKSTSSVFRNTKLRVTHPAKVTGLQVNGREASKTQVIEENQKVSISCSFTNGNPGVTVHLLDDTGRAHSSTSHEEGPLTLSLGGFHCHDVWPTVRCEAPGSELNRSVTLLGKCPPKFLDISVQLLNLITVLKEGITFSLTYYTRIIRKCMMVKLPPKPVTREVTCELSGNPPEFNLTLQLATELWIEEGLWTLTVLTEEGDSNITFFLINKTEEGERSLVTDSSNKTSNTATECITSGYEEGILKCVFTKNIVSTETEFKVYFYPDNRESGSPEMQEILIDCYWDNGQFSCIEQEGVNWEQPESNIFQITVPTRFVRSSGEYRCIHYGYKIENTKACQFFKPQYQGQNQIDQDSVYDYYPDDTADESKHWESIFVAFGALSIPIIVVILSGIPFFRVLWGRHCFSLIQETAI